MKKLLRKTIVLISLASILSIASIFAIISFYSHRGVEIRWLKTSMSSKNHHLSSKLGENISAYDLVVKDIQKVSKLTTVQYYIEKAVEYDVTWNFARNNTFFNKLFKKIGIFIVYAKVDLGVDLEQIKEENIRIQDHSLIIQIPKAQILSISFDREATKFYTEDGLFTTGTIKLKPEEYNEIEKEIEERIIADLKQKDVFAQAEQRVKDILTDYLKQGTGINNIKIQVQN